MTTLWDNIKKMSKDISKKAKEGAHITAEKAEELGKKGKIKYDISKIKHNVEKQFTELGGKVYHAMQEDNITDFSSSEEINGYIKTIKELEEDLRNKEEEMDRVGKMSKEESEGEVSGEEASESDEN